MRTKPLLTTLFAASIVTANITAAKLSWFTIPHLGGVAVPAGFIAIGVAFLCSDLLVELHGKDYTHSVVNGTILSLVVAYALIWLAIMLPVAPFYEAQEAYTSVLSSSTAIVAASILTLTVSQHVDVRVFARLKTETSGRYKVVRNLGSTGVSQAVDTIMFITLAFAVFPFLQGGSGLPLAELVSVIVGQYVVKLVVAGLDTPVFYVLTWWWE